MARLGRTFLAPILHSGGRVWIDASLDVAASVQPGKAPLTLPFVLGSDLTSAGKVLTADASLSVTAVTGNQFPYTFPIVFGLSETMKIGFGFDTQQAVTATPTAGMQLTAYDQSSGAFLAGFAANAVVSTTIAGNLTGTAAPTSDPGRGQPISSSLPVTMHYQSEFPYTFPLVFSPITATFIKGLVGDAALTIIDSPTSPDSTRGQCADVSLAGTATATDDVWLSGLLDSSQTITATRTESDTRNANVDTQVEGIASPFAEGILGRNIFSDAVEISGTASAEANTSLLADADTGVNAASSADGTREAIFFSYDQIITAEITADASIVARADALEIEIVVSDSPDATRNANVDADLAGEAAVDSVINWDAYDLAADLPVITDFAAEQSEAAVTDMFGGEVAASITAEATRNVFCDSDDIPITATINDEDALRNVIVDTDLPVSAEFIAIRSTEVFVECDLAVTASPTEPDPVKGRIGFVDLELAVTIDAAVTYGQPLDADHTTTADSTAGFSQMQPLDGELLFTADFAAAITRHQYTDSEPLHADTVVEANVLFGALTDTDLPVEVSRDGTITRNHNVFASLEVTSEATGAVSFDALLDPDLSVTASSDIDFLRDAIVDSELGVTAGHFVLIYNDAEDESQLFTAVDIPASIDRHLFADADLSVTATIDSPEPSRGQSLDADVLGIVTSEIDPLYNQFLDADMPVNTGPGGDFLFDALLDADQPVYLSSLIDFTKGMSLDSLLDLLAPTEERLRSDFVTTQQPLTILGDTDLPFAFMGRFLYADQPVSADTVGMIDMAALLDSLLEAPTTLISDMSELLSSNFFPFYL